MNLPQTLTYAVSHILEWIAIGLIVLAILSVAVQMVVYYLTGRRRYQ